MSEQADHASSQYEVDAVVRARIYDQLFATINTLIKFSSLVLMLYFVRGMIHDLAGRYTFADIGIKFLGDFRISEALAYIFGVGGIAYGRGQRKLRKERIEDLSSKKAQLEKIIDPDRTSSRLTKRGDTNPEDMP
jgi:hypothetical protein